MIHLMRGRFASWVIGIVIGFIAFVFIFYGVYTPRYGGGLTGAAGQVNGDTITASEFNAALSRYSENLKARGFGEEQLKMFGVQNWAWEELVNQKLLHQEARKLHLLPAEEAVRDQIIKVPAFQRDGVFELEIYKQLLLRNNLTPAQFERSIRDEFTSKRFQEFFRARSLVSQEEIRRDFMIENDRRNAVFVLLTPEAGKKLVSIQPSEIQALLNDTQKMEQVKARYEAQKEFKYKGKDLASVQKEIAKQIIEEEKRDDVEKSNRELAEKIAPMMDGTAKSEASINLILKPLGQKVQKTGFFARRGTYVPNIGEAKDLIQDAFREAFNPKSPAKVYNLSKGVLVARVIEQQQSDPSKIQEKDRLEIMKRLVASKENELYGRWLKDVRDRSKIKKNESLFEGLRFSSDG